jgi:hypothetical protein
MCKLLTSRALCLPVLVVARGASAVPESLRVTPAKELTFLYHPPQRVSVYLPGQAKPVVYWYMLFKVENDTDHEVDFYPEFDLVTDTLRVVRSEADVSPQAYRAIKERTGNPLLIPPEQVTGRLLRGRDRARHSVAIFRDFDPKAKEFTIYVSGLSEEMQRLRNPSFDPARPEDATNLRYFILRKTLAIPYRLPGSEATRSSAVPERVESGQKWLMR